MAAGRNSEIGKGHGGEKRLYQAPGQAHRPRWLLTHMPRSSPQSGQIQVMEFPLIPH